MYTLLIYVTAMIAISLIASRLMKRNAEDIHLGSRNDGSIVSALSASASTESSFLFLGMVGVGYGIGFSALWIVPAGVLGYTFNWLFVAPKIRTLSEKHDSVTLIDFILRRSRNSQAAKYLSLIIAVLSTVFLIVYTSAQFHAAGKAISVQLESESDYYILVGALVVGVYAIIGGYRAITWSDSIQALMMVFALIILPVTAVISAGGFDVIYNNLLSQDAKLVHWFYGATSLNGVASFLLSWFMLALAYPGQPHVLARFMAMKKESNVKTSWLVATIWFAVIYTGAVMLGIAARAGIGGLTESIADPETILPLLASGLLPLFISGIVVAAIFAAICSTADSTLFGAASTVTRALTVSNQKPVFKNESSVMKGMIFLLIILSLFLAYSRSGEVAIFGLVLDAWGGLGATIAPVTLYYIIFKKVYPIAAILGVISGLAVYVLYTSPLLLLWGFSINIACIIIVHNILQIIGNQKEVNEIE